jgi:hypothetical protein
MPFTSRAQFKFMVATFISGENICAEPRQIFSATKTLAVFPGRAKSLYFSETEQLLECRLLGSAAPIVFRLSELIDKGSAEDASYKSKRNG